jgi:CDP-diacylglycerol--glycerol-3-phosphate 3-phosphatidyltransferase
MAATLTAFAGLTDMLDGFMARRLRQSCAFGQNLDLIADKVFVLAALLLLTAAAGMPAWVPAIVALREAVIWLIRHSPHRSGGLAPDAWGKAKTALTFVAIVVYMLRQDSVTGGVTARTLDFPPASWVLLHAQWLMFGAVALCMISGLNYVVTWRAASGLRKPSPDFASGR